MKSNDLRPNDPQASLCENQWKLVSAFCLSKKTTLKGVLVWDIQLNLNSDEKRYLFGLCLANKTRDIFKYLHEKIKEDHKLTNEEHLLFINGVILGFTAYNDVIQEWLQSPVMKGEVEDEKCS